MKLLVVCVVLALFISACNQNPQVSNSNTVQDTTQPTPEKIAPSPTPASPSLPPLGDGAVLRVSVQGDPGLRPTITGETNLPDGTEIMVSVESKTSNFTGQDKASVMEGRFRAGPFGPEGGLKPGQYTASVTMPIPQVQPPQVRAVIGATGENLNGPLVKKGSLGLTVETEEAFQLDSKGIITGGTNKSAVDASIGDVHEVLQALRNLEQQGRSMEALRQGYQNDLEKVRQCGELMRERQPQAKNLRQRAESLPRPYSIHLGSAATEMVLCVSCSRSALENCNRARPSIEDMSKALNIKGREK